MSKNTLNDVLFFTLYPIINPRHGGQHRASNIVQMYQRAGYNVKHMYSVYETDSWDNLTGDYSVIPAGMLEKIKYNIYVPEIADYLMCLYISNDDGIRNKIINFVVKNNVKYIHMEQPWFFPLINNIKKDMPELFNKIKLVYGSQNMEYQLKKNMIPNNINCYNQIISDIYDLEMNITKCSDIVLAVSNFEKEELKKWNKNVILARNGVGDKKIESIDINFASDILKKDYFIFIGSAHKPNVDGFISLIGASLACVPPNMNIVVVGGVNHLIKQHPDYNYWLDINKSKLISFPDVNDSQLQSLIVRSSAIILPIVSGGGTNLKTAEALISNKPIIGTSIAFRDFESYIDSSVTISDTKQAFQLAIRTFNKNEFHKRNSIHNLIWTNCLIEFERYLKEI